jgi:hypothetical protein
MPKSKILYSANSTAAYKISKKYYGDLHYVWCSTEFGPNPPSKTLIVNPPSSQPRWRYKSMHEESRGLDYHGPYIRENKLGLVKGAEIKYNLHAISLSQKEEILTYVDKASLIEYKPLLYVMVYDDVKDLVKEVPIVMRANPLSEEYIIEELPGSLFEILDLDDL